MVKVLAKTVNSLQRKDTDKERYGTENVASYNRMFLMMPDINLYFLRHHYHTKDAQEKKKF